MCENDRYDRYNVRCFQLDDLVSQLLTISSFYSGASSADVAHFIELSNGTKPNLYICRYNPKYWTVWHFYRFLKKNFLKRTKMGIKRSTVNLTVLFVFMKSHIAHILISKAKKTSRVYLSTYFETWFSNAQWFDISSYIKFGNFSWCAFWFFCIEFMIRIILK